jgi:hypothetical protein
MLLNCIGRDKNGGARGGEKERLTAMVQDHKVLEKAVDVALELEQIQLLASLGQVQAHTRSQADAQARADALMDALATQKKDKTVVHTRRKIKIVFLRYQTRRSSSTSSMRSWTTCTQCLRDAAW